MTSSVSHSECVAKWGMATRLKYYLIMKKTLLCRFHGPDAEREVSETRRTHHITPLAGAKDNGLLSQSVTKGLSEEMEISILRWAMATWVYILTVYALG